MRALLALAQDIAVHGARQHGFYTLYPVENNEQRFGVSSGVLEVRIASHAGKFTWMQLLGVLEGLEHFLLGGQRYYKTWFEFWSSRKQSSKPALGRGKLFKTSEVPFGSGA